MPLSFNQEALWLTHELDPGSVADRLDVAFKSETALDGLALRAAFQLLLDRHESLRTTYRTDGDGRAQQIISVWQKVDFETVDATGWNEARVRGHLTELRRAPFDLTLGPLMQVRHFAKTAIGDVIWLGIHHLATDLVSFGVLMSELPECYLAATLGRPPRFDDASLPYREFVAWQRAHIASPSGNSDRQFWKQRVLDAAKLRVTLAADRPRTPVRSTAGASVLLTSSQPVTRAVRTAARDTHASEATILVSAFQVLLAAMTGERDVAHGFLFSGRPRAAFENTAGLFTNIVPRTAHVDEGSTFRQLVEVNTDEARHSLMHRHFPMPLLARELAVQRTPDRAPLFDVVFGYQALPSAHRFLARAALGAPGTTLALENAKLESLQLEAAGAQFDLTLVCHIDEERDEILIRIEYSTELYDRATVERIGQRFIRLVEVGAQQLDRPIRDIAAEAIEAKELEAIERGASRTIEAESLHRAFERQVDRTPDAVAVSFEGKVLKYRELDEAANAVAHTLQSQGFRVGESVAVCMERSLELVVALYGVVKAGGAYVPLAPADPASRREYMAETSGARHWLISAGDGQIRAQHPSAQLIEVDAAQRRAARVSQAVVPKSPAYVLFTSGSTGRPKGVCVPHDGIVNRLEWMQDRFRLKPDDVVLQKTPYTFDVSVWEFFWPLLVGARLEVARPEGHRDAEYLNQVIQAAGVTTLHFVPSMLDPFLEEPNATQSKSVRRVIVSGEALKRAQVERLAQVLPSAILENLYGPTEASVDVTYHRCEIERSDGRVPIGRPVWNTQLYVLDEKMRRVPRGAQGELYLGGVQLALGYASKASLTAECFLPDPFGGPGSRLYRTGDLVRWLGDGELEYLGRIDGQVKIRGQRVELGEIESILQQHPDVMQAAVVVRQDPNARLIGFVVGRRSTPSASELEQHLARSLPSHMVPASWVFLTAFPQTSSGKIDRNRLPEAPREDRWSSQDVATPNERILAEIWQELLGVEKVGPDAKFFELGGDSIIALQMTSRARRAGLSLRLRDVFEQPTLAALALRAKIAFQVPQNASRGKAELTAIQRWFFEQKFETPDHWNQSILLDCPGVTDVDALERAINIVLAHHDALRLRFGSGEQGAESFYGGPSWVVARSNVGRLGGEARQKRIEAECASCQAQLSLREGPLSRVVLFTGGPTLQLFWTTHHMVVDGVSWRILIDQVWEGYRELSTGNTWNPPAKTTSWQTWSERIGVWTRSGVLDAESRHWIEVCHALRDLPALPRGTGGNASWDEQTVSLDAEQTKQLAANVRRAYRAGMEDALLSALVGALAKELGTARVGLTLEHHGRESPIQDIDLSGTVGWFTSLYPVLFSRASDVGEQLAVVKDALRQQPRNGLGYGLLRYLRGDPDLARELDYAQEVTFNYLGQLTFGADGPRLAGHSTGRFHSDTERGAERLAVNATVGERGLEVSFAYDRSDVSEQFVQAVKQSFTKALHALAAHVAVPGAGHLTPSDFELVSLTPEDVVSLQRKHPRLEDVWPLTHAQQGMLLESERETDAYSEQLVLRVRRRFDERALRNAWSTVVSRHDVLRTMFARTTSGDAVQVLLPEIEVPGRVESLIGVNEAEAKARLDKLLAEERAALRQAVIGSGPLIRFGALREGSDRWVLVWTMHHAVIDGWSLPLIARDLLAIYDGHPASWLGPAGSFRDFVRWMTKYGYPDHGEHWRALLGSPVSATRLPGTKARTTEQIKHRVDLDEAETARLREVAKSIGITLSTLLHAAWALSFGKYAGTESVLYGQVVSGRSVPIQQAERTVGPFISTLPVRVHLPSEGSVREWLRSLNELLARSREHEHDRIVDIRRWCQAPLDQPLFDAHLAFENYPLQGVNTGSGPNKSLELVDYVSRTESRIELTVTLGNGMAIALTHDTGYCDRALGKRILDATVRALKWLASNPS